MAMLDKGHYVATFQITDDSQGRMKRSHSIGIKADTAVPETEDPWATVVANVAAYQTELEKITDGQVLSVSINRTLVSDVAISVPLSSENERKAVFSVKAGTEKGTVAIPSLDEDLLETTGWAAGLAIDMTDADVISYVALLTGGNYLLPQVGDAVTAVLSGKKMHTTSGKLGTRIG